MQLIRRHHGAEHRALYEVKTLISANFHTHTFRCHHAEGTEREYIETALGLGMKTLGFSDHTPYFFDGDYYSGFRMDPEQLPDYVRTLTELREEYRGRIDIHIGLEAEYYPRHFDRLLEYVRSCGIEYLILGQHFTNNEYDGRSAFYMGDDIAFMEEYTAQVCEALGTGLFSYVAHPDMPTYTGSETARYELLCRRICEAAEAADVPVEFNLQGFVESRPYPKTDFFRIAHEVGCRSIIGCDAHRATMISETEKIEEAEKLLSELGVERTESIEFKLT